MANNGLRNQAPEKQRAVQFQSLMDSGNALVGQGKHDRALASFSAAKVFADTSPERISVWSAIGQSQRVLGQQAVDSADHKKAHALFNEAALSFNHIGQKADRDECHRLAEHSRTESIRSVSTQTETRALA